MALQGNISYNAIAEAKSVGSEIVGKEHLFIAIVKTLLTEDFYEKTDEIVTDANRLHQELLSLGLSGIKPPSFSKAAEMLLKNVSDPESADLVARSIAGKKSDTELSLAKQKEMAPTTDLRVSVGDLHSINGPNIGRLPKIVTDRTAMIPLISPFLLADEEFLYDGVYNTRDANISTRHGNAQSMGRMVVTNLRLIFWSDDFDKPHIGAFYSDITFWKTNWMPLKSRGVVMNIGGRKVIFAANSNAVETASRFLRGTK